MRQNLNLNLNNMTAVEWLVNEANLLENNGWILPLIEQAKEMEKEQQGYSKEDIERAFKVGYTIAYGGDIRIDEKDEWFNRWFKIFKDDQNEKK